MNSGIFIIWLMTIYCFKCMESTVPENEAPRVTETGALVADEPRKKQQENNLMQRILPMLATPFIFQVTILPMVLMGMKFMLLKSMLLGKLGVLLWIFQLIRSNSEDGGALYSHNINVEHNSHPGHSNYEKQYQYSEHYNNYRRRRRDVHR